MNTTKRLTEAALLSSLFVISTIIFVGSGIGYGLYLDFVVPIFFCIVCIKCELKYAILSAITSLFIVALVLGNIGMSIWITQSIILGVMCGFFILKSTTIIDDIFYTSILGVILIVLVDVYFSTLIGYSFMKDFQEYALKFPFKEYIDVIYYTLISSFCFGTVFSIYTLSLLLGKKLNILKGNSKKKLNIIINFRSFCNLLCFSDKVFYIAVLYIIIAELINIRGIRINSVYFNTIIISIKYLCTYFVIRDSYVSIQNYLISKYQRISSIRILKIITLLCLVLFLKITTTILIILSILINIRVNIRIKQINIINNYVDDLVRR